jgi:hypothetical protein
MILYTRGSDGDASAKAKADMAGISMHSLLRLLERPFRQGSEEGEH